MERYRSFINLINFGLVILLIISVLFTTHISLPDNLMFIGRMHALVLHLPIGMFLVCLLFALFRKHIDTSSTRDFQQFIIELTATSALLSAQIGMLLAQENGYTSEHLYDHKVAALLFAFGMYIFSEYNKYLNPNRQWIALGVLSITLMFAGHNGGIITHGEDFLFPKNKSNVAQLDPATSSVYEWAIHPILTDKCMGCHNKKKSKGDLILTDSIHLSLGGENGAVVVHGISDESNLVKLIELPLDDDDHMPPKGKAQLNQKKIQLIKLWIDNGLSYSKKLSDLNSDSTFAQLLTKIVTDEQRNNKYQFKSADPLLIENISSPYVSIRPIAYESPALEASFFVASSYKTDKLKDLIKLKDQIVSISLINMPLMDDDMDHLTSFERLEKLNLNGTSITDNGLSKLIKLKKIKSLSLMGTKIGLQKKGFFSQWPVLQQLYLSNTNISYDDIEKMKKEYPHLIIHAIEVSRELTALSPPRIKDNQIIYEKGEKITLQQRIQNAQIKYTLDGSEPDSTNGNVYLNPFIISQVHLLKTIVFKDGWLPSPVASYHIFSKGITPVDVQLLSKPSKKYPGSGAITVIDGQKAPIRNLTNPNWIGFLEEKYISTFEFENSRSIKQISLAYGLHLPAHVFPPTQITVFASNTVNNMKQIAKITLPRIKSYEKEQTRNEVAHIDLPGESYSHYKIIAQNLPQIPSWHSGKGTKAWLFIDEIFFYE